MAGKNVQAIDQKKKEQSAEKAAKLKKAAEGRVMRAIAAIDAVGKLANMKLSPAQVEAIQKAFNAQVELTVAKLTGKVKVTEFTLPS